LRASNNENFPRFFFASLLILPALARAQIVNVPSTSATATPLTHATDCRTNVPATLHQLCTDLDDGTTWICKTPEDGGNTGVCDQTGEWVTTSSASSSGVTSFEGRTGVVTAASGDYIAAEITNTPAGSLAATNVQTAINEIVTEYPLPFTTQNAPAGTDPVADSTADTLNWVATAPITITGDATTDTLTVAVTAATTTATGVVELATDGENAANVVVQGNDARLSNARTPTAHATSHQHGGSDEIATATPSTNAIPKTGGAGTLDDGWLAAAITRDEEINTFAEWVTFTGITGTCNTTTGVLGDGTCTPIAINAFTTMNAPAGTDPVADTATDTLNWVATAPITITGNETTDTMTIAVTGLSGTNTGDQTITLQGDVTGTGTGTFTTTIAANAIGSSEITDTSINWIDLNTASTLANSPGFAGGTAYFGATGVFFEGPTADTIEGMIEAGTLTADRTWTLPDASGTFQLGPLAGDVVTSGVTATIQADSVALTTDTTGNYVADVAGTANEITVSHTPGEGSTATASLPATIVLTSKTVRVPNSTTLPATCTTGDMYMDTDATSGSRWYLCESTNTWVVQGAAGSGDITDVWTDSSGDVSALTAASGDTLDAGAADSSKPATRSTSLPATCTEGQQHHDTDSGGSELYVCTTTNTWIKIGDLSDPGSNGLLRRTAAGVTTIASLQSSNGIAIDNPSGAATNPTIRINSTGDFTARDVTVRKLLLNTATVQSLSESSQINCNLQHVVPVKSSTAGSEFVDLTSNPQIIAGTTVGQECVLLGAGDPDFGEGVKLDDSTGLELRVSSRTVSSDQLSRVPDTLVLRWNGTLWSEVVYVNTPLATTLQAAYNASGASPTITMGTNGLIFDDASSATKSVKFCEGSGGLCARFYVAAGTFVLDTDTPVDVKFAVPVNRQFCFFDSEAAADVICIDPDNASRRNMFKYQNSQYYAYETADIELRATSTSGPAGSTCAEELAVVNGSAPRSALNCTDVANTSRAEGCTTLVGYAATGSVYAVITGANSNTTFTNQDLAMDISAAQREHSAALNSTWGSTVAADVNFNSGFAQNDQWTVQSAAITPNGSCTSTNACEVCVRMQIDDTTTDATMANVPIFRNIKLLYLTDSWSKF
jgi:hypothetical protein